MSVFLQSLGTVGAILLVVVGLEIILGLMNVINLAQTGLMGVGVYGAVSITQHGGSFVLAVLGGAVLTAVVGFIVELVVIRRLYARPLETILATWGLSLVLVQAVTWTYGPSPRGLNAPVSGSVTVAGAPYETYRLIIVGIALAIVLGLAALTRFTRAGLRVRMVMSNPTLARGLGINTVRVQQITFVTGAALAGTAGALIGPTTAIVPNYGATLLVPAFLAVLLSGKSLLGMTLACAVLGTVQVVFATLENATYATVVVILVAVIMLRLRPEGLIWRRA